MVMTMSAKPISILFMKQAHQSAAVIMKMRRIMINILVMIGM